MNLVTHIHPQTSPEPAVNFLVLLKHRAGFYKRHKMHTIHFSLKAVHDLLNSLLSNKSSISEVLLVQREGKDSDLDRSDTSSNALLMACLDAAVDCL